MNDAPEPLPGERQRSRRLPWRGVLRALHRDFGYLAVGLTVVYAVSGIAVNHREDWNYNYAEDEAATPIGVPSALLGVPAPADAGGQGALARARQDELVARITTAVGRTDQARKAFWRGPDRLSLFFGEGDGDIVDYRPKAGLAEHVVKSERVLVRDMNYLHLNEGRGAWTWVADGFAVVLVFLALSGIFLVKGKKGLVWRGAVLITLGVALPVVALVLMR